MLVPVHAIKIKERSSYGYQVSLRKYLSNSEKSQFLFFGELTRFCLKMSMRLQSFGHLK